ncbi:MAG: BlaI/MecI/CopY family transcriptional regulator [Burkholderiaceae bacterium]|nr:BlaI/MecI/CopY family transcriptional regulator [Burkholderiaceae bacterium]
MNPSNEPMDALDSLPLRERQVVDLVYSLHEATATQIQQGLEIELSNSAVRAMLVRLEEKGVLRHRIDGPRYLYQAVVPKDAVRVSALRRVVGTFFDNSAASAASALLGMSDKLSDTELDALEAMIAKARAEGR